MQIYEDLSKKCIYATKEDGEFAWYYEHEKIR